MQAERSVLHLLGEHEFLFLNEVGRVLRKSPQNLYPIFKSGALTPLKLGGRTVVRASDLRRYLDSLPVASFGGGHAAT